MVAVADNSAMRRIAQDRIETVARSIFAIRGLPSPGGDQMSMIVGQTMAGMSDQELRSPESISASAIGQIDQMVTSSAEAVRRANIYSAEAARTDQSGDGVGRSASKAIDALDRLRGTPANASLREGGSGALSAGRADGGARYDGMGSLDWGSPAGLAKMRDLAIQKGMSWAANNPELLRLGPAAIGALADVHFKQETYKRLTTDASFKAKDIVVLARFAKEQHVDANHLGNSFANVEKVMTPQERARFNSAVLPYMANSTNPEKSEKAVKAFDEARKAHPEKKELFDNLQQELHLKKQSLDQSAKVADEKNKAASSEVDQTAAKKERANDESIRAGEKKKEASASLGGLDAMLGGEPGAKPVAKAKDDKDEKSKPASQPTKPQTTPAQASKPTAAKVAAAPAPH